MHTLRIPARSWVWANNLPGLDAKCINCRRTRDGLMGGTGGGGGSGWKESCGQADEKIVEEVESSFEGIFKVHATILADSGVKRQTSN